MFNHQTWVWERFFVPHLNPISPGSACLHVTFRQTDTDWETRIKQVAKCLWGFFSLKLYWSFVLVSCVDRLGGFKLTLIDEGGLRHEYLKRVAVLTKDALNLEPGKQEQCKSQRFVSVDTIHCSWPHRPGSSGYLHHCLSNLDSRDPPTLLAVTVVV